jgi:hypothetical protein
MTITARPIYHLVENVIAGSIIAPTRHLLVISQTAALRQKPPVAKPLDKTSDLIRKGQNLPVSV